MNTLSWFFYFASVIPSLGTLLVVFTFFGFILLGIIFFCVFLANSEGGNHSYPGKSWVFILILTGFIAALLPSEKTLYMIAASELGETAYNSEEGKEVISELRQIIDFQLGDLKGDKSE